MKKRTSVFDKVWDQHIIEDLGDGNNLMLIDRCLVHELGGEPLFELLDNENLKPYPDKSFVAVEDHTVSSKPGRTKDDTAAARRFLAKLEKGCKKYGVRLYDIEDPYQGIIHVVCPELGLSQPGMSIVCGDSHTCTHGAVGALAWGSGTSMLGQAVVTHALIAKRPKTMRVNIVGTRPAGIAAMDINLFIISKLGTDFGIGYCIEWAGPVIDAMTMEERMSICNMTVEFGSEYGIMSPDEKTIDYVRTTMHAPQGEEFEKFAAYARSIASDKDAEYDKEITLDITGMKPYISWGVTPSQAIEIDAPIPACAADSVPNDEEKYRVALNYMDLQAGQPLLGKKVDRVFIGSCTNGRLNDLKAAAEIVKGKKVAPWVEASVVAGSQMVKRMAEELGIADIFKEAGFAWGEPGCAYCNACNGEVMEKKQRSVSSTNRNFVGRQGADVRTHLASPATAAWCAITGYVGTSAIHKEEQ